MSSRDKTPLLGKRRPVGGPQARLHDACLTSSPTAHSASGLSGGHSEALVSGLQGVRHTPECSAVPLVTVSYLRGQPEDRGHRALSSRGPRRLRQEPQKARIWSRPASSPTPRAPRDRSWCLQYQEMRFGETSMGVRSKG